MNNNSWHKKEKPLMGLLGSGGGAQGTAAPSPIDATGGTKATPGDGYIYHLFTSSGSLVINSGNSNMDVLIVGGGGGGGFDRGGGGGAGAFRPETLEGSAGTHPIAIGAAGNGGSGSPGSTSGGDTTLTYASTPYIAGGGGGGGGTGGSPGPGTPGSNGGSGGGGGYGSNEPAGTCPDPTYGNPGKLAVSVSPTMYAMGGGGGGAGSGASPTVANPYPYQGPVSFPTPGPQTPWHNASDGKTLPWIPTAYGVDGNFCGGGAGGGGNGAGWGSNTPTAQKAGAGRGAAPTVEGTGATANTGSGGGGGSGSTSPENPSQAGNDGSNGIVLFRYEA